MRPPFWSRPSVQRFILRFFVVFILVQILLLAWPDITRIQHLIAGIVGLILNVPAEGVFIILRSTRFEVTAYCTGIVGIGMWWGLLFGFRAPEMNKKIIFGVLGSLILFFANILRIAFVVFAGRVTSVVVAEWLHIATWFLFSVLIVGLWYWLISTYCKEKDPQRLARKLLNDT